MVKFIVRLLVSAVALAVAAWIFGGISVDGSSDSERIVILVVVAAIFGVINAFVAPVVKVLSLPFIVVTLGLMLLVINALMLMLTAWVADKIDIGFTVDGFWTAVGGAIVITLVTWAINLVLPESVDR